MRFGIKLVAPIAMALACAAPVAMAADGSDAHFNRIAGQSMGTDTGSGWFNYYVDTVNQQIARIEARDAYGAAGPNGPTKGFDGYLSGFVTTDTGSMWFNEYVDQVNVDVQSK